ncbi:hypothetical protein ACLKA7_001851, partial [Drosophila subpalustris]
AHLAGVPDITTSEPPQRQPTAALTTTMEDELAAFRKVSRLQHTPPSVAQAPSSAPPIMQPKIFSFSAKTASEEDVTPKRTRSYGSPTNQTQPHKKHREKAPITEIEEIGALLDVVLFRINENKVRSINQAMKSMFARMKELQLVVQSQLSAHNANGSRDAITVRNQAEKCQQTTPPERLSQAPKLPLQAPGRDIAVQTSAWRRDGKPVPNRQTPRQSKPQPQRKTGNETAAPNQKPRQQNLSQPLTLPTEEVGAQGNRARQKWTEVKGKHARRKAARRPDAIIIKCSEATPYSEVLKTVKAAPNLQSLKDSVKTIRKSASGELILRMHRNTDPATEQLHTALSAVFSGKAEVKAMQETVDVEVLDIDETTTAEEVLTALFASLECDIPARATPHMRKAYGGTQIATLALQPVIANKVLESGKVRIGWVVCRVRRKIDPKRCFRCMGFGHTSSRCRSQHAVSKETCFKCADTGHTSS